MTSLITTDGKPAGTQSAALAWPAASKASQTTAAPIPFDASVSETPACDNWAAGFAAIAARRLALPSAMLLSILILSGCTPEDISTAAPAGGVVAATPAPASVILVPISVRLADLHGILEDSVPKAESGSRLNQIGRPVVDDTLTWDFQRTPISLVGRDGTLVASTSISGIVRVRGKISPIRGSVGRLLGNLRPDVPFSAHADVSADASVTAAPILNPNWTLDPQLTGSVRVTEATIPIGSVAKVSVRGEIQPMLDEKVAAMIARLNARIADDGRIRRAAAQAWAAMCRAHPIAAPSELGTKLFLIVEPKAAHVLSPSVNADALIVTIGVTATTRLSELETQPDCRPLPDVTPASAEGLVLDVPIELGYPTLSEAITAAAARRPITSAGGALELAVEKVDIRPAGDEVSLSVDLKAREMRWFGASYAGTVHLLAKPQYDAKTGVLHLADIRSHPGSDEAASRRGPLATLIVPTLLSLMGSDIAYSLAEDVDQLNARVRQAIAELDARQLNGLKVSRVDVGDIRVDAIEIGEEAVIIRGSARGFLSLAASATDVTE